MGKADDEDSTSGHPPPPEGSEEGNAGGGGCPRCRWSLIRRVVGPRCATAVVLGLAVLLSALFWLPPFLKQSGGRVDPDGGYRADIVASFRLQKPVALLNANISRLQYDIYEEIGVPNSSVVIISLEPLAESNWTNVVFAVWPYPKYSKISSTGLSLLKDSFVSLVLQQSTLHLTTSLFGNSSFFQVVKFPGGITISPQQNAFLLQRVKPLFNFTLNFSIYQVQDKISDLKGQMEKGLLLNSYENLYVRLTNVEGSTVAPPTIVQTSVVLRVGNRSPSLLRLKELAKTITNSSNGNLGLNHTVFGRVKQVQLSSFLRHSLNSGGSNGSPSPAPQPHLDRRHHHYHHHRHHRHHSNMHLAPMPAAPAPAPLHSYQSPAPSGCRYGFSRKPKKKSYQVPVAAPVAAPLHSSAPLPAPGHSADTLSPPQHSAGPVSGPQHSTAPVSVPQHSFAPHAYKDTPAPSPHVLPASPLPAVSFAHVRPPTESVTYIGPPAGTPSISPAPCSCKPSVHWVIAALLYLLTRL